MPRWADRLLAFAAHDPVVMITVIATEGSTPRDLGARMLVTADIIDGSIGGGRLEFDETAQARTLLTRQIELGAWYRETRRIILGPDAGQCCGGVVEVLHEVFGAAEALALDALRQRAPSARVTRPLVSGAPLTIETAPAEPHTWSEPLVPLQADLYLYGAGHTAREIVRIAAGFPIEITWIDIAAERFPPGMTGEVLRVISAQPAEIATAAPPGCLHLVMTHRHDLDFAICEALLHRADFAFLGLIGSATKRARFTQRFRRSGMADSVIARLVCPIGIGAITGKAPAVIALATVAQLVMLVPACRD